MARFGWAYVDCADTSGTGGQADGVTGSVQFLTGANATSGSNYLMYKYTAGVPGTGATPVSSLILTGTLYVSGAISASHFHYEDITRIDASGSTDFGNTNDDTHARTGSLMVTNQSGLSILSSSAYTHQTFVRGFGARYTEVVNPAYEVLTSDHILGVSRAGVNIVITVPSASIFGAGSMIVVKDEVASRGAYNITLTCSAGASYTFDGSTTYIITGSMPAISLYSNGSNWFVF